MRKLLYILSLVGVISACNNPTKQDSGDNVLPERDLARDMAGKWRTLSFEVHVNSFQGQDKDTVIKIANADFGRLVPFIENRGEYKLDGTFEEFFYKTKDSILIKVSGSWITEGDTIYVQQLYPSFTENKYQLVLKNDTGTFTSYLDWDRDGKADDYYIGTSLKLSSEK